MIKNLLTFLLLLIGAVSLNAQTISGTVTDINGGAPIANQTITINSLDSNSNPYTATAVSNSNGIYSFNNVPTTINGYVLYTFDCQQQYQSQYIATNSGTVNFSICTGSNPTGCNAAFSSMPDSSNSNLIYFIDQSTGNPTSWTWNFGDGNTSSAQNPTHQYATSGTYVVSLNISSSSCSNSISQTIVVGNSPAPCNAAFYIMPDSSNSNLIYFNDQSTGNPTSWSWNFGDGSTSSAQNPTHQYATSGTYVVSLNISSSSCSNSITLTIAVGNSPAPCNAAFFFYQDSLNQNTYYFYDQSSGNPTSWTWNFGDGTTSNQQNPTHTYTTNGTYFVTLLINSANCFDTTSQSIVVGNPSQINYVYGYVNANSSMVNSGTVSLFDPNTNQFVATTTIDSSYYLFGNVPNGTYKILATPDTTTSIGQNFAPTYYGDVIFWSAATSITVPAAVTAPYPINLVTIPAVPGGNGSISGNVGTGAKSGSANTIVNLLDNNMDLVTTTKTNANGDYNFSNLAVGTYKIWVEIAGKTTTPIAVTLTTNDNSSNSNDFVVNNNEVLPKTNSISNNSFDGELNLYPNPVVDIMNVKLTTTEFGNYNFNIYNITGQLISTTQINISSSNNVIRINTNELPQGTYFLRIENSNSNSIQKLFVK